MVTQIKAEISNIMDELYVIWKQNNSYCYNCPFDRDKKIKWMYSDNEEDSIEICPLDASIIEYWDSRGRKIENKEIPKWIIDNWTRVKGHHENMKLFYERKEK